MLTLPNEKIILIGLSIFGCCLCPLIISFIINLSLISGEKKQFKNKVSPSFRTGHTLHTGRTGIIVKKNFNEV